jgi:FKBP-type peptidyl-prolyl cis-trans isomerase 2
MNEGDFIRLEYVGRIKESGEIFDLTKEEIAKESGVYNPEFIYKPVPVIIGSYFIIKGIDEELRKMKVGEKKKIIVNSKDGFGDRSEKLIKLIPLAEFKKQKIDPFPGMPVTISNLRGRVLSISGGRVKVDFNHPLAGKELEYDLEIKEEITEKEDKIKAVFELFTGPKKETEIEIKDDIVELKIGVDIHRHVKEDIVETIKKWIKDIKKIRFVEEFDVKQ